jgi:hypothetical protein
MIKDVMTFLPKPERNGIWVLRIGSAPANTGRAKTNASISTLAATCTTAAATTTRPAGQAVKPETAISAAPVELASLAALA